MTNEQLRRILLWAVAVAGVWGSMLDAGAAWIDGRRDLFAYYFLGSSALLLLLRYVDKVKARVEA